MAATPPQETAPDTGGTPPLLRVYLFGGFRVERDSGAPLADRWPRPSAQSLVKLLAVSPGHALHRDQAIDVCWPDADHAAALGSLRVALHAARRAIEPELAPRAASSYLTSDSTLLRLDPRTVWIDADEAEERAEKALADASAPRLADALAAFTGELLPEDRYAPWTSARRGRLSALRERVLLALAAAHLAEGAPQRAADAAQTALDANPAEERAHRILIEALLAQGLRRQAMRQYHRCRQALDTELGVRPGPEIERLHRLALDDAPRGHTLTPPVLPAPLRTPAAAPLHGRDRALTALSAPDGPAVRLVRGEAGLGKTRLVAEAARRAAEEGAAVLWGAGHDAEGHTPYGVFAEALDGWLAHRPPAERAQIGAEYPELAALLPSLGPAPGVTGRSPEEERDRLFRAVAGLLGDLSAHRPLWVVLDDLHAADAGSYQLLSHLARLAPARGWRFAATVREDGLRPTDPRQAKLDSLVRQDHARWVALDRLDRAACLAVAADAGAAGEGERVWELSLGNPLFALELARSLRDGGGLGAVEGVRQLVAERLAGLSTAARRMVEVLAVAVGDAPLTDVLAVAAHGLHPRLSSAEATDALDSAVDAALIAERSVVIGGRPVPGLAFRHPLVRLTCYEQLSAVRRRQLHSAYAEAVLTHRPEQVDALATHFARADDPRAAGYLRQAAERAAALYANDTADRYYRDLIGRLDLAGARARLAYSQVLRRMGNFAQAAQVLREALEDFGRRGERDDEILTAAYLGETLVKVGDPEEALAVLVRFPPDASTAAEPAASHLIASAIVRFVRGEYREGAAAAERALAAAQSVPGARGRGLEARALSQQAANHGLAGRFAASRHAADRALAPAEEYGEPSLLISVLSILRENARRGGQLREAIAYGRRALDLAEHSGDPTACAFERANLAELHLLVEEFDEARALAEASARGAELQAAWCLAYALAALARVLMRIGDTGAHELLARGRRAADEVGDRQAGREVSSALAELAVREGRFVDALDHVDATSAPHLAAWAHAYAGRTEEALRIARDETERARLGGERIAEVEALVVHAFALGRSGRLDEAARDFVRAETLSGELPYPAGLRRAVWARAAVRETGA
ncbi:AAA family ATPase [Streptomyces sp. YC504]|uniref:AAA family ATPase n=1 Tax=Streptomyces mesophilus TaxID=1775132 RepID=A0A6G4XRF9_9ACTN|nr:AAA family ATPase [Streptomyces mesophilus]NGO80179.1 AAA family ATPase [Streptomyces mesophilus]